MNVDWNIVRQEIAGQKVPSAMAKRGGEAPIAIPKTKRDRTSQNQNMIVAGEDSNFP